MQIMVTKNPTFQNDLADTAWGVLRAACRRMAGSRCAVEILVFDGPGGLVIGDGADDAGDDGQFIEYRHLPPAALHGPAPWFVLARVDYPSRPSEEREFWVNEHGAWLNRSCTSPLFLPARKKLSARAQMANEVGLSRVEEAESILTNAVREILSIKALRQEGFRWNGKPKIAFRWSNRLSRGGLHGVAFGPARLARSLDEGVVFREYAAFASDPMIGSFRGTRKDCLRVLAAHEMAHWLQYDRNVIRPPGNYKAPHGSGFRKIYWILRDAMGLKANIQGGCRV